MRLKGFQAARTGFSLAATAFRGPGRSCHAALWRVRACWAMCCMVCGWSRCVFRACRKSSNTSAMQAWSQQLLACAGIRCGCRAPPVRGLVTMVAKSWPGDAAARHCCHLQIDVHCP